MTGYGYGKITTWLTNSPLMAFCAEISRASALRRVSSPTGLSSGEKRAGGAQDGWRHRINLILAHQAQRNSVSQFRIHARQPSLHDGGRIVFAQGTRHLKSKPQPALSVAVDLASADPTINSPRVLDAPDIRGQFPPNDLDQLLDDLRGGKPKRFPMGEQVGPGKLWCVHGGPPD